jgi:glycosyltransferase involved in cell wall biosynthesis
METLVTIGICVCNGGKLLPNAIESILTQDFPPEQLEVIFVDDGSQDSTPEIIQRYLPFFGGRAKFLSSAWKGLGHARNLIVKEAGGKYVLFVDADERLTSGYVKAQVEVLEKDSQVGVTAGVFKTVPDNLILNLEVAPYIVNQRSFEQPKSFIWKTDKLIGTGGTAFRTEALKQVKGFDEYITGAGEDTDLILRIKKAGWRIQPNLAEFYELHGGLSNLFELWRKYFWYGYSCQKSFRRIKDAFSLPRMSPLAGFVAGLFYSFPAYRFLHEKHVFLLPWHFGLKQTAWTCGFIKGQLSNNFRGDSDKNRRFLPNT